jgi:hypothetical protein
MIERMFVQKYGKTADVSRRNRIFAVCSQNKIIKQS